MARIFCCLTVAFVTVGVAQSAPPTVTPSPSHPQRIRFLSLAEARAIALENGASIQFSWRSPSLSQDAPEMPKSSEAVRVFARLGKKGILITGIAGDPRRNEYERNIDQLLLNIENAYWNLYGSYWNLHTREQALRMAYDTWKLVAEKYRNNAASLADFSQAQGQYELFRTQRLTSLDTVLDNERQLRAMLGLPIENDARLVPSDAPTRREKKLDWEKALTKALKKRPDLRLARKDLRLAEAKVEAVEKAEHPHPIRPVAWEDRPSNLRTARLQLQRTRLVLQDQELKTERFLGLYYRRLSSSYFQIKAAHAQREAFATQLTVRGENYRAGKKDAALDLLLEAQRFWADAVDAESQSTVTYNNAIAGWEYAKGNIMTHARVRLGEELSSDRKAVRAVVHERKRTRQYVRRASGVLADSPLTVPDDQSFAAAPSLPALWKSFPPLRSAEELPPVESNPLKAGKTEMRLRECNMSDIFPSK